MKNVSDKSYREYQNIHFVISKVFPKIVHFMRKCIKNCGVEQATDDNMAHERCLLDA